MNKFLERYLVSFVIVLFLLSFSGVVYLLIRETNKNMSFNEKELLGVRYHKAFFDTLLAAQNYRGHLFVDEYSGNQNPETAVLKQELKERIAYIESIKKDTNEIGLSSEWEESRKLLLSVIEDEDSATPIAHYEKQSGAIHELVNLMRKTGSNSNLALDSEIEPHFMMRIMVNIIPNIVEDLGYVRGKVSGVLTTGNITKSEERDILEARGRLKALATRYREAITIIEENDDENISNEAEKKFSALEKLEDIIALFQNITDNKTQNITQESFFLDISNSTAAFDKIYKTFFEHLEWHFNKRIEGYKNYRLKMLLALMSAFVVALGASTVLIIFAKKGIIQKAEFDAAVKIKAIWDTVLDGIITIDPLGIVESFNPSAGRIFGYKAEEVIGKNVNMLMPEPYHSGHDGYVHHYLSTGEKKIIGIGREVSGKRKDGSVFPMDLGVNEIRLKDSLTFVGTIRDISERKESERQMKKYLEDLKRSNQELDDFAYIASHDLKEPLRGLSNNALFLKEDFEDKIGEDGFKRLNRITFLCERMERLVNDLLYFSRLGRQELAIQKTDLNEVIHDIKTMMEATLHDTNTKIVVPNKLPTVICDLPRITEVFRNLITNAVKYNDKLEKVIKIGCEQRNGQHVFFVRDNGIGIPEEFYNDIFRIFKRLNDEDDKVKGTGVGLTFVKKIIERHNGKIWVESSVGSGTTFFFTINNQ